MFNALYLLALGWLYVNYCKNEVGKDIFGWIAIGLISLICGVLFWCVLFAISIEIFDPANLEKVSLVEKVYSLKDTENFTVGVGEYGKKIVYYAKTLKDENISVERYHHAKVYATNDQAYYKEVDEIWHQEFWFWPIEDIRIKIRRELYLPKNYEVLPMLTK